MNPDIEPRQLFYNRTGNLSQTTALDPELAAEFMQVSDLRLDVNIEDSDKKPSRSTVAVGSDVLAWRGSVPLTELTRTGLKSGKYHQTQIVGGQYQLVIHDRIIDGAIRRGNYQGSDDYNNQYLRLLNAEIKGGLAEILGWEKLGLRTQRINWLPYIIYAPTLSWLIYQGKFEETIQLAAFATFVLHPLSTFMSNITAQQYRRWNDIVHRFHPTYRISLPPYINPRDWKHALMPMVPVDKWIRGRIFLARHGDDLVVNTS